MRRIVERLQADPELGRSSPIPGKAQGRIGSDAAASLHDFVQSGSGDSQTISELVHAHEEGGISLAITLQKHSGPHAEQFAQLARLSGADRALAVEGFVDMAALSEDGLQEFGGGFAGLLDQKL